MLTRSEAVRLAAEHAEAASGLLTTATITGTDDVSRAGWHAVTSRALSSVAVLLSDTTPLNDGSTATDMKKLVEDLKAARAELFDVRGQLDAVVEEKNVVAASVLVEVRAERDKAIADLVATHTRHDERIQRMAADAALVAVEREAATVDAALMRGEIVELLKSLEGANDHNGDVDHAILVSGLRKKYGL